MRSGARQNKHQEKSEATRTRLFDAALQVFAKAGFEAARIEDIASLAGYTRGAFYAHFETKEELFFALLEEQSQMHREQVRHALERCDSSESRLKALREYYVTRANDRLWTVLILEFKLYALRHPKARARLAQTTRSIREKMKWEGLEDLWPEQLRGSQERQHLRKMILQAALSGLVLERAYDPASISGAELTDLLRRIFDFALS